MISWTNVGPVPVDLHTGYLKLDTILPDDYLSGIPDELYTDFVAEIDRLND